VRIARRAASTASASVCGTAEWRIASVLTDPGVKALLLGADATAAEHPPLGDGLGLEDKRCLMRHKPSSHVAARGPDQQAGLKQ
jgi:hypothetical protein